MGLDHKHRAAIQISGFPALKIKIHYSELGRTVKFSIPLNQHVGACSGLQFRSVTRDRRVCVGG